MPPSPLRLTVPSSRNPVSFPGAATCLGAGLTVLPSADRISRPLVVAVAAVLAFGTGAPGTNAAAVKSECASSGFAR